MRKEIYVSVLFFVFCLFALSIYGQSESLEQLRKKFEAGLRESSFLEDYWNRLKLSHEDAVLKEKVLDCYLLSLPLSERYTQDRMIDIVSQIQTIQANVIADIMINWDSLSLNLDQKQMVLEKIDQLLALNCFNWIIQQQNKQLALGCFNWITQQQNQSKIELPLLKDLEEHLGFILFNFGIIL